VNTIHLVNDVHTSSESTTGFRQARRRDRTEQIVTTAMLMLSEGGFEALTINKLARRLKLAPAALYRYFSSKDALIAELQARAIGELERDLFATLEQWRASRPDDAATAALCDLVGAARFYMDLSRSAPRVFYLLARATADPHRLVDEVAATQVAPPMLALLRNVSTLFVVAETTRALEQSDDPVARAASYWAALHGAAQVQKLGRLAPQVLGGTALGERICTALLRGWGARDDAIDAAICWARQRDELRPPPPPHTPEGS